LGYSIQFNLYSGFEQDWQNEKYQVCVRDHSRFSVTAGATHADPFSLLENFITITNLTGVS